MRKLIFNLHLYVALIAGVFILLLGITGGIMAFEPELDHVMHPHRSYVKPAGTPLSLAELSAKVLKSFPGDRIGLYRLSTEPNISYGFLLEKGPALYVNQYTGDILEQSGDGMDFLGFVHQLHLRLAWQSQSRAGDKIMSWAGVAMLFLALSGIYLWWPAKRFRISPGASGRRFWFDLHSATGIFSLVLIAVLAFTGVMIGFEKQTVPMFYKLTGSSPSEQPKLKMTPSPGATPISPDQVLAIARDAMPGAAPFLIFVPRPTSAYQVRLHFPEDLTPGGRSRMLIDQYSGKVLFAESSRTAPAGTRMVIANRAIHTGDIFGIPSKTIMSLASLAAAFQAVSGVVMWWKRTRKRQQLEATKQRTAVPA